MDQINHSSIRSAWLRNNAHQQQLGFIPSWPESNRQDWEMQAMIDSDFQLGRHPNPSEAAEAWMRPGPACP
jgi:hypothetical protein